MVTTKTIHKSNKNGDNLKIKTTDKNATVLGFQYYLNNLKSTEIT